MNFKASHVAQIEQGLEQSVPGAWQRLEPAEQGAYAHFGLVAAWRVAMPKEWHRHGLIDHVVVGLNGAFPFSDPIVVALQGIAKGAPHWPHIDPTGNVCLRRLRYSSPAATRVLTMLEDARDVLNMPEEDRHTEHRREFLAYWAQQGRPDQPLYLCVLDQSPKSRDIVFCGDSRQGVFFAEDANGLNTWLSRTGKQPQREGSTTRLIWLDQPLLPHQFPKTGRDVMGLAGDHMLEAHVRPGSVLPVLIGCEVGGAAVYVCAEIEGISAKDAAKGFRPSRPRPAALVASSFNARPATARSVQRGDAAWVHGRGRNADLELLRGKRVAVVGCGALGGFLAHSLAQAGVGSLVLIDSDELLPSNVGRHLLGMKAVGEKKSLALARKLLADFPHAVDVQAWSGPIQAATDEQQVELAGCDLIIAAGIHLSGELVLDRWRGEWQMPPAMLWTWIEEFAVAGHAVALLDGARLIHSLDADGQFQMRMTSDWPADQAHALEAGCGVAYQPYSAADMMGSVNCAHRLSLDVLLGKQQDSVVRSWLGNRDVAVAVGCTMDSAFDRSFCEISREWSW